MMLLKLQNEFCAAGKKKWRLIDINHHLELHLTTIFLSHNLGNGIYVLSLLGQLGHVSYQNTTSIKID